MSDIDVAYAIRAVAAAIEKLADKPNYVINLDVHIDKDTDVDAVVNKINAVIGYKNRPYVR